MVGNKGEPTLMQLVLGLGLLMAVLSHHSGTGDVRLIQQEMSLMESY